MLPVSYTLDPHPLTLLIMICRYRSGWLCHHTSWESLHRMCRIRSRLLAWGLSSAVQSWSGTYSGDSVALQLTKNSWVLFTHQVRHEEFRWWLIDILIILQDIQCIWWPSDVCGLEHYLIEFQDWHILFCVDFQILSSVRRIIVNRKISYEYLRTSDILKW